MLFQSTVKPQYAVLRFLCSAAFSDARLARAPFARSSKSKIMLFARVIVSDKAALTLTGNDLEAKIGGACCRS